MVIDKLNAQDKFTKSEAFVANYIIENVKTVIKTSIDELAVLTYSSPTTIMRLCKKLGVNGFTELKIELATEINTIISSDERIETDIPISGEETEEEINQLFLNLYMQSINDTFFSIDTTKIAQAAKLIHKAQVVSIYGRSDSLMAAENLHQKLMKIGICSTLDPLEGFQHGRLYKNISHQVAVVFTHYASSRRIKAIISDLRYNSIPFIIITANENSLMVKLSDVSIIFSNKESYKKMGSFSSIISMNYIADCLYATLFRMDFEKNMEILSKFSSRAEFRNKTFNN